MEYKTLNGNLVAYRFRPGSGPVYVFANSLGSDQSIWDKVIAGLPAHAAVLAYDMRGHGASGVTDAPYTIDLLADDLIALIEAVGISDVILCGVSVGGLTAQAVAIKRPDLLRGLVLSNTAPRIWNAEAWSARIADVQQNGFAALADGILAKWFAPDFAVVHADAFAGAKRMLLRNDPEGYANTCAALRDTDLSAEVGHITTPTVCITGDLDLSVPPAASQALADAIPGATCITLDGSSHLPCLDAPAAVTEIILELTRDTAPTLSRAVAGEAVRRCVLGDAHVDKANASMTDFDAAFQTLITEGAWGTVWASDAISPRERSMITLALLAALGNFEEIPMHIQATLRTGASRQDVQEAFQHVAIYAGVPRANHALKLAKRTFAEMDADG